MYFIGILSIGLYILVDCIVIECAVKFLFKFLLLTIAYYLVLMFKMPVETLSGNPEKKTTSLILQVSFLYQLRLK